MMIFGNNCEAINAQGAGADYYVSQQHHIVCASPGNFSREKRKLR